MSYRHASYRKVRKALRTYHAGGGVSAPQLERMGAFGRPPELLWRASGIKTGEVTRIEINGEDVTHCVKSIKLV